MATEVQIFLNAVKTKNWEIVHGLLPKILSNPGIDKRAVLSAIEERHPTVVQDMLNIKMGRQPLKKSRHTFDDDSDDDFETGGYVTRMRRMPAAQAKAEKQSTEVTDLIKRLQDSIDEEERLKIEKRVADIEAEYAEQAAAAGRQLEQQQERLVGEKRSSGDLGGKSRRKRKNKTAKKTKRRKTVKRRKSNKKRR
uniref:Uncharacterized protein n=1 Tax=viral metagenome TaxID=1070528 RepID=A0A6C0F3S1_9ZZZZ